MLESRIYGFINELFYFSKNNPTKITYNTTLIYPGGSNIKFEYAYQYDQFGRPVSFDKLYPGNSQSDGKMEYKYLTN